MGRIYRDAFIRRHQEAQQARRELHANLWQERQNFSELLSQTIPRNRDFHHALEMRGDIPGAVATGVLGALKEQGYARTSAEHLTPRKLRDGCRAWSIEWLGYGGLTVDRTSKDQPQAADLWHRVELVVKVNRDARRIDTEFFSLNEQAGLRPNTFDDREKLHVVWEVPSSGTEELRLAYLGFGTNEPYDVEHLDRGASSLSGRPRFYIFDRDRGLRVEYDVQWQRAGRFDWVWCFERPQRGGRGTEVSFVEMPDSSLICISDEEMANAASNYSRQTALEHAWTAFDLPGAPLLLEDLEPKIQNRLLALFRRVTAIVHGPIVTEISNDSEAPSIEEVLNAAGAGYLPYFVATSAARAHQRGIDRLLAAVRQLEPSRAREYQDILEDECAAVFESRWNEYLPRRMVDLLQVDLATLPGELAQPVQDWVENIRVQIDRDLYHYGQNPADRIHRLRLGVWLALSVELGDVYASILNVARGYVDSGQAHGRFDVTLP